MAVYKRSALWEFGGSIKNVAPGSAVLAYSDELRGGGYKDVSRHYDSLTWDRHSAFNNTPMQSICFVSADKDALAKINSLDAGDQIALTGLAADIKFYEAGDNLNGEPVASVNAAPHGDILFIRRADDIKILRRATRIWKYLFYLSLAAIVALFGRKLFSSNA